MAFYYDSYYANTPAKKVRTQPKRECNNITYIYMNRDKRTIHNEPQYEARHEATKQNMFGLIGNQKTYEASLQRETTQYKLWAQASLSNIEEHYQKVPEDLASR